MNLTYNSCRLSARRMMTGITQYRVYGICGKKRKRGRVMQEILTRAGCFVAIIILGYVLRKVNFFQEGDFKVLSKIVLRITLPAAIVSSFAGKEIDPSMLALSLIGMGGGLIYMGLAYVMNRKAGREMQAFGVLNGAGYNIGNFTLPFVRSFLGPAGVIATSLFDTGNAFVCLGGSYGAASAIKGGSGGFSLKKILLSLIKSVPFDCYVVMTVVCMANIPVPSPVVSFAQIIGNGNAFLAMLMIGVGFKLSGDREQIGAVIRILAVRYGVALLLSLGCFFLLPLPLEVRQALAILVFSPIASAAPAYTAEIDGNVGLASFVNSLSIVISIVCIVIVLALVL